MLTEILEMLLRNWKEMYFLKIISNQPPNCRRRCSPSEVESRSADHDIHCVLKKPNIHYHARFLNLSLRSILILSLPLVSDISRNLAGSNISAKFFMHFLFLSCALHILTPILAHLVTVTA